MMKQGDMTKLIPSVLLLAGAVAIVFAINYNSSVLAFIGLGLVFWGAVLFYIRPEKYVRETLLDMAILPSLANLDQMIKTLGFRGKAIYLPPKYFEHDESTKTYISAEENGKLPLPEEIQREKDSNFVKNPQGLLVTPPGTGLAKLFEKALGVSFAKVNLLYLEQHISKLLVEDLEMAKNVEIQTENCRVYIKIEDSIYGNLCNETRNLMSINSSLGCPMCSALACALARATGKQIKIESEETSENGKTMKTRFILLED